jgi:hypothetical protein
MGFAGCEGFIMAGGKLGGWKPQLYRRNPLRLGFQEF